jgi:hypothetical protein
MQQHHGLPYSIHICETHTSSASSCTVPLFVMREVKKSGCVTLHPIVKIHNAENVKASQFFRFNVLGHCLSDIQDISCNFFGRQRIADFVYDPKSVLISHSRFLSVRPYVLEALWIGIPTIHNSLLLKNLGGEASLGYYEDNDIIGAREAFKRLLQWKESNRGESALAALTELRKKILETFSPMQQVRSRSLEEACKSVCSGPAVVTVATPPAPSGVAANSAKPLRIGFCDMWELFNPEYNMFTLMVNATGVRECIGVGLESLQEGDEDVDLVVFGPFGNRWQTVKTTVPLVHYTGENTNPIVDPRVKLNLGFQHLDGADDSYLRLPLWMLEINWFGANVDRIQNPKPLPIDRCTKVYPAEFSTKSKFCAFVVTNPRQPMRNAAFQWISNYKHVDSAGRLFNNVGEEIFAGLGGGGGELKKLEFLKNYKFCIAYENESSRGYTTEKYLHAKAAGCIPIYWGDPVIERDFDMEGAIDARSVQTASQLV